LAVLESQPGRQIDAVALRQRTDGIDARIEGVDIG